MAQPVNTLRRPYDSSRRRAQAAKTREEILAVATSRFLADGYAATTLRSIAREAGVSVETIHKAFGGKAGLLRAMWVKGLEGEGPVPAEQRSDALRVATTDPYELINGWARFVAELSPHGAPIILLIRSAAAVDPEMRALLAETEAQRLRRMEENARMLYERGDLRPEITLERARDVLWTYSSAELYELLVLKRSWSPEEHAAFVARGIAAALLPQR